MKTTRIAIILLGTAVLSAVATTPEVPVYRWQVRQDRLSERSWSIKRQAVAILEPSYADAGSPVDLASVYEVKLRWRPYGSTNDWAYATNGIVTDAAAGTVQALWLPGYAADGADVYDYEIALKSATGQNLNAFGLLTMVGSLADSPVQDLPSALLPFDWSMWDHINIGDAPFATAADLHEIDNRLDGHDQDIIDLTDLVGDGVAGVTSNLQEHIQSQAGVDAGQDAQIQLALDSATMGNDVTGPSTNATVVSTRGRLFPAEDDAPQNMEAIVWDDVLGGMTWGSVDLTAIWTAINNLITNAVTQTYVDTEVSRVEGMVDGNDHILQLTEEFESVDWLEIASGVWQHNTYGWLASGASVLGGQLTLNADTGTITIDVTNHVSKVGIAGTASKSLVAHAETLSGPWTGYDTAADNIPYTNRMAIRVWNSGGTSVTLSRLDLYSWTHPERVGAVRDFAGLTLRVDTPDGTDTRETANVGYVRTLPASGSISGTFATGFSVDKFKTYPISTADLLNGMGMVYYSSVNEFRPVDVATQFELDAAIAPLCTIVSYNALAARMTAAEAGTSIPLNGEVVGTAASNRVVKLLGANLPTGPAPAQHTLIMGASGWELKSILASNIVYAAGTNDIASVPAESAAFYRADYQGTNIMVMVLDQQVVAWFGPDGMVLPYGTLDVVDQLIKSNVQMYDGSAASPALRFLSDPTTGWYRAAANAWRFMAAGNLVADISNAGITMAAGKDVILNDGFRAASIDEIDDLAFTETDPLAVHQSTTTQVWTHVGGTYTNESVVATSDVSSNGFAAVTYDLATGNGMDVVVEMSDLNLTEWTTFAPFAYPGYVRISLVETLPSPAGLDTTISNIAVTAWTRPDLYSNVADTAGQIIHVDTAVQARQPVPLAQYEAGLAGVTPANWSQYDATQDVNLDGKMLLMGNGWTLSDVSGLGVISYTDMAVSTNSLQIAANLVPAITATAGYSGLTIATLSIDGGTGTVGVATNGVTSTPILQWTASLSSIQWQNLTPISEPYLSTNAAGHYEIVAEFPSTSSGFFRAVQPDGTSRVDVQMPLYVQGDLIETGFVRDGTNLLWVIGGVTNRVSMEAYP